MNSPSSHHSKYRRRPTLVAVVTGIGVAAALFVLWRSATLSETGQMSILPGPLWLFRYNVEHNFLGLPVPVYLLLAALINFILVGGIAAVVFSRRWFFVSLAILCALIWIGCGMLMRQLVETTYPLQSIEDRPGLPRVLLIGDSISIGYTLHVRKLLEGRANVHRPPTNCKSTRKGLEQIDRWLGGGSWDIIHFNFGLHDVRFDRVNRKLAANISRVPIDEYERNLRQLVARLKKTGATLIWQSTTPVPQDAGFFCQPDTVIRYNEVAADIMRENDIIIHDLFQFASAHLSEIQRPRDVHFTYYGSQQLGRQVALAIQQEWSGRETEPSIQPIIDPGQ